MITSKHINARGEVALWEATDDGHRQVMLAATDAAHALAADPERWSLIKPGQPRSDSEYETRGAVTEDICADYVSTVVPDFDDPSKQGSG